MSVLANISCEVSKERRWMVTGKENKGLEIKKNIDIDKAYENMVSISP